MEGVAVLHVIMQRPRPMEPWHRQDGESKSLRVHIRGRMGRGDMWEASRGKGSLQHTQLSITFCLLQHSHMVSPPGLLVPQTGHFKHQKLGAVLRWQRKRTGRPLSPSQIHQKNISTLIRFHKTTSECWQRTSGTQKSRSLSSKTGRKNIKDGKKRQKR